MEGGRQWLEDYLEWEDDNLALLGPLNTRLAISLKARKGRKRDLLLPRVLPISPEESSVTPQCRSRYNHTLSSLTPYMPSVQQMQAPS